MAFRNCKTSLEIIEFGKKLHSELLKINPQTGDDAVISSIYLKKEFRDYFRLLPQLAYPTGNLLNLFSRRHIFGGLYPEKPFIFHANYVIGLDRKIILSYAAAREIDISALKITIFKSLKLEINLLLRRIKNSTFKYYRKN